MDIEKILIKSALIGAAVGIIALITVIILSVSESHSTKNSNTVTKPQYETPEQYPIIKIRDCEYIVVQTSSYYNAGCIEYTHSVVHCADCRNTIHKKD